MALSEFAHASAQMQAERAISPRSELPCLRLAAIALRVSKPTDAARWAKCALQLAPDSADGHYLLGRAELAGGDTDPAIRELETARSLDGESPQIRFSLARAYAQAGMPAKARREREMFLELSNAEKNNAAKP